jgi:hypothetical protein
MFFGLSIFENLDFETSSSGMEDGNGIVGLGGACNHIFNEIIMFRNISDDAIVFSGFMFVFCLELIQHLHILE